MTTVPGEGPLDASVCLIGEAPGAEEEAEGRPFCGESGKLLNRFLASAGLVREQCYVTNVVKERPPGNDISTLIAFDERTGEAHPSEEFDRHEQALYAELEACRANVLVPLGGTACYSLTRHMGIRKRRGSILRTHPTACVEPRKCLPTLHPAAVVRGNYLGRYLIVHDLIKVKAQSGFPEVRLPRRNILSHLSAQEAVSLLDSAPGFAERVGLDIETTVQTIKGTKFAKDLFCFSMAVSPSQTMVVPLVGQDLKPAYTTDEELAILLALGRLCENPNVVKVGQNIIFDATYLYSQFGIRTWPIDDTMVAHRLLYSEFDADLGFLCSMYTDEPYYKDIAGKWFEGKGEDMDEFIRYSGLDAAVVLDIMPELYKEMSGRGILDVYRRHINIHPALLYIQQHGFRMDLDGLAQARRKAADEIKAAQAELDRMYYESVNLCLNHYPPEAAEDLVRKWGLLPKSKRYGPDKRGKGGFWQTGLNVKSTKQKLAYFALLGVKCPTAHGKPTTDVKAIKKLVAKGVTEAKFIKVITQLRDDKAKYWDARLDPDGRARCSMKPVGTIQGRLSSTKTLFGTGFNFQNQPPRMEQYMVADPDCILVSMDLAQAENRIVSYLAQERRLIEAFESGRDIHRLTAGLLFGKRPEDISDEDGSSTVGDGMHSERFWGKKCNHAMNYGIGPEELSLDLEISMADARWLLARYHLAYPRIRTTYHGDIQRELLSSRTLTNLMGRRQKYFDRLQFGPGQWFSEVLKRAYSFKPQSTVADVINEWGILPMWQMEGVEICNQIHDSIVFQFNAARYGVKALARTIVESVKSLERPLTAKGRAFTIPVEAKVGLSCGAMKGVSADPETLAPKLEELLHAQAA